MITLKTLHQATLQEIFNQAANHLLTQNEKSKGLIIHNAIPELGIAESSNISCKYRNKEGLKCAIGVFISDEEYNEKINLLKKLQRTHDAYKVEEWKERLILIAHEFNLKFN